MDGNMQGRFNASALTLLRVVAGFLFFCHGAQKLLGWFTAPGEPRMAIAFPELPFFAGIIELGGGALIALGIKTRPVAFIASGEMAFAYFMAHAPHGFWPIMNHGELAALYCFLFLFLAAHGGGPNTLEAAWRKKS